MNETTVLLTRHKLDVDAYYRMAEAGILAESDRVELIDGEIIDMVPVSSDHGGAVNHLTEALVIACLDRVILGRAIVQVQGPVRLDRFNEVEPDFAILRRREDYYRSAHPGPDDVLALVEVAKSFLRFDRKVDIHRQPGRDGYAEKETRRSGGQVALALDPAITVDLQAAFGP